MNPPLLAVTVSKVVRYVKDFFDVFSALSPWTSPIGDHHSGAVVHDSGARSLSA
jgi:hypothetical protein